MSNKTDGKKALEAGDYALAEEKLLKALEYHPDDSELWWAMMLLKSKLKNDAELKAFIRDEFLTAAKSGASPPKTPFESSYCKNALRYETDGRRRNFIKKLYDELSVLWLNERGERLNLKAPREKKLPDIGKILTAVEYAAIALIAVGVWLVCYALLVYKVWALWTGFDVLVFFALAAFIIMRVLRKLKYPVDNPTVALFSIIVLSAAALLIVGILRGFRLIVIMAAVVLAIAAAIGLYKLFARRKEAPRNNKKTQSNKSARDPVELMRAARGDNKVNSSGGTKSEKADKNEFQDEFD